MVESTIDKIKDITVERQIRKLAGIIDEQNQKIDASVDFSTDIKNLQDTTVNQGNQINNLKQQVAADKLSTESAITNLQSKDSAQDTTLATHDAQIQGITESLVSDVQILDGITTGEIKVRIDREDAASIDSNSYNLGLPVSAEIIQGTGPSMFKVQITLSSGVKVVSNDFVFTTEAIGTDVYISSFTFKAGTQDGYLSADIGLNNGVTIEANNFLVPTDPGVISNITDLQNRMTAVEAGTSVSGLEALKTQVQTNTTDIESINTEISGVMTDLDTKADLTNTSQTISALGYIGQSVYVKANGEKTYPVLNNNAVTDSTKPLKVLTQMDSPEYGTIALDTGYVALVDDSGNPKNFTVPSGGEEWEKIDFNNWPTDWSVGDRIKVIFKSYSSYQNAPSSWVASINNMIFSLEGGSELISPIIELELGNSIVDNDIIYKMEYSANTMIGIFSIERYYNIVSFNAKSNLFMLQLTYFNGSGAVARTVNVSVNTANEYIYNMWRLKK